MNEKIQLRQSDIKPLREKLLTENRGLCPICGKQPRTPCLDHDHKTGLIRDVLCRGCNALLGKNENNALINGCKLRDLPTRMRQMADFLEKDSLPYIHPNNAPKKRILTIGSYNRMINFLFKSGYMEKIPAYKMKKNRNGNEKPAQGLTKPLKILFDISRIEPKFYK